MMCCLTVNEDELRLLLKVLAHAERLVALVEGPPMPVRWQSPAGLRFKDENAWAGFYCAVKDALENNKKVGARIAAAPAQPPARSPTQWVAARERMPPLPGPYVVWVTRDAKGRNEGPAFGLYAGWPDPEDYWLEHLPEVPSE